MSTGDALALDFDGIEQVAAPFADEFLAKLVTGGRDDGRIVTITNASPTVCATIESVLARRGLSSKSISA